MSIISKVYSVARADSCIVKQKNTQVLFSIRSNFQTNDFFLGELLRYIRVIEFLRNFELHNWHTMRGELMLPDSISEEKLENGRSTSWAVLV